jgi:hypothetical protein
MIVVLAIALALVFAVPALAVDDGPAVTGVTVTSGTVTLGSTSASGGDVTVPAGVPVTVTVTGNANAATYSFDGGEYTASASKTYTVASGTQTVTITAKDASDFVSAAYTVNLVASTDSTASAISSMAMHNGTVYFSTFSKTGNTYTVNIPNNATGAYSRVYIAPVLSAGAVWAPTSGFSGNYIDVSALADGGTASATFTVTSAFGDPYKTVYTINIVKASASLPSVNTLSSVAVTNGTKSVSIKPTSFPSSTSTTGSGTVISTVTSVDVAYEVTDPLSTVEYSVNGGSYKSLGAGNGSFEASLTKNKVNAIRIRVTAQNSTSKIYTLNITRGTVESYATLEDLNITYESGSKTKTVSISPSFKSSTYTYTASVNSDIDEVNVEFETTDENAEVKVYRGSSLKGTYDGSDDIDISLSKGSNEIKLVVTSSDEDTKKTYKITITRGDSSVNTLSAIALRTGSNANVSYTPSFSTTTKAYTANVANDVAKIALKASLTDSDSSMTINGNSVSSGAWSSDYSLSEGNNSFIIKVTAQDGSTNSYSVNVVRAKSTTVVTGNILKLYIGKNTAYVNDRAVTLDAAPFLYTYNKVNYTMVPIRFVGEQGLGAIVNWNGSTKQVNVSGNGKSVTMTLGVANPAVGMLCPPVAKNNRIFVPIRYVAESLGCTVDYTSTTLPIVITSK